MNEPHVVYQFRQDITQYINSIKHSLQLELIMIILFMDLNSTWITGVDSKQGQLITLALFKAVEEFLDPIYSKMINFAQLSLLLPLVILRFSGMLHCLVPISTLITIVYGHISHNDAMRLRVGSVFDNTRIQMMVIKRGLL